MATAIEAKIEQQTRKHIPNLVEARTLETKPRSEVIVSDLSWNKDRIFTNAERIIEFTTPQDKYLRIDLADGNTATFLRNKVIVATSLN